MNASSYMTELGLLKETLQGEKFLAGRKKGMETEDTKKIREFVQNNPDKTAKEMQKMVEKNLSQEYSTGAFATRVSRVRNQKTK